MSGMSRNRMMIVVICVLLCAALGVLIVMERRYPEAGSEMMRRLLGRGR